jgi:CBS domain-containing protein
MSVARVLARKGHDVITVSAQNTLQVVAGILAIRRVGAAVVVDAHGVIAGIISERDIIRAIGESGPSVLDKPVSAYMTAKVFTTTPAASLASLMQAMTEGRFRHVPVLTNGALDGLISIGDVVKTHLDDLENEHRAMRDYIATA